MILNNQIKKLVKEYAKKLVGKRLNEASYVPEVYIEFSNIQNAKKFNTFLQKNGGDIPGFELLDFEYDDKTTFICQTEDMTNDDVSDIVDGLDEFMKSKFPDAEVTNRESDEEDEEDEDDNYIQHEHIAFLEPIGGDKEQKMKIIKKLISLSDKQRSDNASNPREVKFWFNWTKASFTWDGPKYMGSEAITLYSSDGLPAAKMNKLANDVINEISKKYKIQLKKQNTK